MDSESNAGENTESSLTALHLESEGSAGLLWEGHAISGDVEAASEIDAAEAAEASAAADGKSSKKKEKERAGPRTAQAAAQHKRQSLLQVQVMEALVLMQRLPCRSAQVSAENASRPLTLTMTNHSASSVCWTSVHSGVMPNSSIAKKT